MRTTIIIGGKAGQGPNILTQLVGETLVKRGFYVFYSRDYQSLIRGGHNFNILTFSDEKIGSNDSKIDVLVCLDENTEKVHKSELKKEGIIIKGENEDNMFFAGRLFKTLCLEFKELEEKLKKLKNFEENLKSAKRGYEVETKSCHLNLKDKNSGKKHFMNGTQGITEGALKSGLEIYYAYPMTPATPLLFELAPKQLENKNLKVIELESEIAVINAAIGSSIIGAKVMLGTSGGGFDLMTESFSMAGQAEIPLVCYNASRPGPSTGVATYSGQGDLQLSRYTGHGEFFRLVLAPSNAKECAELTSQCFYFTQKYKIPAIILSDKHLAESFYTFDKEPEITSSEKSTELIRYNSYEHTKTGESTEDPKIINQGFERRKKKEAQIEKEAKNFQMFKSYGNKNSKNVILSWGSTKSAVLDAIKELDCKFIQILYFSPFPDIEKEIHGKNLIVIENNFSSPLSDIIREKTGIKIEQKNKILRYDGRPFLCDELKGEIEGRLVR